MENNLVFRWSKPLLFMVLGAEGTKTKKNLKEDNLYGSLRKEMP